MVINFNVKLSKWKILEISDSSKEKIIQFLEISHFSLQPDIHQVSSHFWISIQKRFNFDNWQSDCYLSYRKISLSRCNYHDLTTIGILRSRGHPSLSLSFSLSLVFSFVPFPIVIVPSDTYFYAAFLSPALFLGAFSHTFTAPCRLYYSLEIARNTERGDLYNRSIAAR